MNISRKIRRLIPAVHAADTVRNMMQENSIKEGLRKTLHEDICEDSFVGAGIYNTGVKDGYRMGYKEASEIYETKLRRQSEAFFEKAEIAKNQINKYRKLLLEYEKYIEILEGESNRTKRENILLQKMIADKNRLENLHIA